MPTQLTDQLAADVRVASAVAKLEVAIFCRLHDVVEEHRTHSTPDVGDTLTDIIECQRASAEATCDRAARLIESASESLQTDVDELRKRHARR